MESAESLVENAFFIVEANSFEKNTLWLQWSKEGSMFLEWKQCHPRVEWKDFSYGQGVEINRLGNRPHWIVVNCAIINGFRVLFWHSTSQVTDSAAAELWLKKYFKRKWRNSCDASNFHNCIRAIEEAKEKGWCEATWKIFEQEELSLNDPINFEI